MWCNFAPSQQGTAAGLVQIKNLKHARDRCDGLFRVVWITASDPGERIRKTERTSPGSNRR
jgi:hypothetical protein